MKTKKTEMFQDNNGKSLDRDTVEDDIEIEVEFQGKPRLVFGSQYIEIVKPYIISSNQMEFKYENEDNRNNQFSS